MSLFPRWATTESPLFSLLDEYATLANQRIPTTDHIRKVKAFAPKFDVKETKDAYELHGDLPGIEQQDVDIEWTDGNTLTISGRVERRVERRDSGASVDDKPTVHQATVEDATEESEATSETAVAKVDDQQKQVSKPRESARYWVTERSVGEFHRTFSFPSRVDQDGVKASLRNGVLSIIVPKSVAPKTRKIVIE